MACKTDTTNLYIVINPEFYGIYTVDGMMDRCRDIIKDIQRHVDYIEDCHIRSHFRQVCEFCDHPWKGDGDENYGGDPNYNGGCCEDDQKRHEEFLKTKKGKK